MKKIKSDSSLTPQGRLASSEQEFLLKPLEELFQKSNISTYI